MKKFLMYSLAVIVGLVLLAVLIFAVRQAFANTKIEREWQQAPASIPELGATTRLEILPLYENDSAAESFDFGHGVSYLIHTDSATILMDLGNNPAESAQLPALQNLQALGISWEEIEFLQPCQPTLVALSPHDSSPEVLQAFQSTFPEAYRFIRVGEAIQFP